MRDLGIELIKERLSVKLGPVNEKTATFVTEGWILKDKTKVTELQEMIKSVTLVGRMFLDTPCYSFIIF